MASLDTTLTLDQLVDLSIRLDNLLTARGRPDRDLSVPSPSTSAPTPMELGGAALRATGGGAIPCISLFLNDPPAFPMVMGLPWLACLDLTIAWQQRAPNGWSRECSGRCVGVSIGATTMESPDQVSTVRIPSEYADLALAFCKKRAIKLPPHQRGDW